MFATHLLGLGRKSKSEDGRSVFVSAAAEGNLCGFENETHGWMARLETMKMLDSHFFRRLVLYRYACGRVLGRFGGSWGMTTAVGGWRMPLGLVSLRVAHAGGALEDVMIW